MDGMYLKLFEPVLRKTYKECGTKEVKSTGQKEVRIIDTLEPVLGSHKMIVTPECINRDIDSVPEGDYKYALFYQMTRITSDRGSLVHDDRLDALAIGVKYLVDFMGIDADEGINEITSEWLEESLEAFHGFITKKIGINTITENVRESGTSKGFNKYKYSEGYKFTR